MLVAAALFWLYLRQSGTQPTGADGATLGLQAWDMLHGNPLLRGWAMSDVSFWPWELGEYSLVEAVRGLSPAVVHVGGALTYTLVLVLAALLAGSAGLRGRMRWVAAVGTSVILLSPGLGLATRILLQEPDHFGSAVPVLLAWLVIAGPRPVHNARWAWVRPVLLAVVLTIGAVGDPLILATGTFAVALGLLLGMLVNRTARVTWPFLVAAVVSWPLSAGATALVRAVGGFHTQQVRTGFAGWPAIWAHLRLAGEGIAGFFGAGFSSGPEGGSGPLGFALVHLAGVVLVVAAIVVVLIRPRLWADPVLPGLTAGILALLALFAASSYAVDPLSVREVSAVVPFGAVLAGRMAAGPALAVWDRLRTGGRATAGTFASMVLAGYVAALGQAAAQPQVPALHSDVASWLTAHRLSSGLALSYWLANSVTIDSGGQATVREIEVHNGRVVRPAGWGHRNVWYSPANSFADYVLSPDPPGSGIWDGVIDSFGNPARVYHPDGYWVLDYHTNLLSRITD